MFAFGNMTHNSGAFYNLFFGNSPDWKKLRIDSRSVRLTNKDELNQKIELYGLDSDYCRVRILALPPKSNSNQCISYESIQAGKERIFKKQSEYRHAPCIIGIDGAWTGKDSLEVYARVGNFSRHIYSLPKNNNDIHTMSAIVGAVRAQKNLIGEPDGWIIDLGWGTGLYSAALSLGIENVHLVAFGGSSPEPGIENMRTYMWLKMGKWLDDGGSIYGNQDIELDLQKPQLYTIASGKHAGWAILESKEDMQKRGVSSPNHGDALACTFGVPIQKRNPLLVYDYNKDGAYVNPEIYENDYGQTTGQSSSHYDGMI